MLLALTMGGGAEAFELKKSELERIVIDQVTAQSAKQLQKFGNCEIEVKVVNLSTEEIIKTAQKPIIKVESNFDKFMQYDIKKVIIIDGMAKRSIPVNVKIAVYKDVLAAKEFITQFQLVNHSNTYIKRLDVANNIENVMDSLPMVLVASKNITKDAPVLLTQTKEKPDIVRNSGVKIFFTQGDELTIELDGTAMKEGKLGDIITVKNTKYNRIYTATVVGENRVEVKL